MIDSDRDYAFNITLLGFLSYVEDHGHTVLAFLNNFLLKVDGLVYIINWMIPF